MGRSTDRLARTLQPRYVRAMCGSVRLSSDVAKSNSLRDLGAPAHAKPPPAELERGAH